MRWKYRKTVAIILALQTALLWCYILLRPVDTQWKDPNLDANRFDGIHMKIISTENNKTHLLNPFQKLKSLAVNQVTSGDCVGMEFPGHLVTEESWSAIDNSKNAFVFSAYVVDHSGKIKAVGASTRGNSKLFCQYWHVMNDNHTIKLQVKSAAVKMLPENHGNKYSGAVFDCPSSANTPTYVSMVTEKCNVPFHVLVVKNAIQPKSYQRKFTICLKPLHFRYGRAYELVEWIELNSVLGAEKVFIYNYSIARNTDKVLENYVKTGFVELVQWNLPIKSYSWPRTKQPVDIHSIGMLPMLQDCLLRSKAYSEFVINLDVDEFIIPRGSNVTTWHEMMDKIPSSSDTYLFRNTFFRKEWNSSHVEFPNKNVTKNLRITSLQHFEREDRILAARSRSKYFTRTNKEKRLMIHEVSGGSSYVVPIEIGLLHHYRNWEKYNDNSKRVEDKTVLNKYGEKLIDRVQRTWKELGNVTLEIPI